MEKAGGREAERGASAVAVVLLLQPDSTVDKPVAVAIVWRRKKDGERE